MRIVHAVNWSHLSPDAAIEQVVHTAAALARQGAHVTLLMPQAQHDPVIDADAFSALLGSPAPFAIEQIRSILPGSFWRTAMAWLMRCHTAPSAKAADVIISRMPASLIAGAGPRRSWLYDQYRPFTSRNPLVRERVRRMVASPLCRGLALHSHLAAQSFLDLGLDPAKVLVAHNGVDPALLAAPPDPPAARARFAIPPQARVMIYAGRLTMTKGIETLLAMARERPDMLLILAGSQGEGPVERLAAPYPNVRIVPWLGPEDLRLLLAAADILVIPPSARALAHGRTVLPIKTFAYLAAGKPILAPDLPDTRGLLVDGETAILVPPDDPASALAALDTLVSAPALARELGARARRLATSKTWDARARLLLDHLEGGPALAAKACSTA